jgi:phospholipase/carboxylesterase
MKYVQHEGDHLKFITVEPNGFEPDRPYPLVVLLHGFGAHMGDLAGLASAIDSRGYIYAFPNAPISMDMGLGGENFVGAPLGGDGAGEALVHADRLVGGFLEEVMAMYPPPPGKAILGGFSQGGMMAYRNGLPHPDRFAGIAALSSVVIGKRDIEDRLPEHSSQAVFASHGTDDNMISVTDARQGIEFLRSKGYDPEYNEYSMGHEVSLEVISDLTVWVHKVLAPYPPASIGE